ncbi:hypothetical protein J6TS1_06930 [Siminovitchia terrae]|uniref:Uncharacterized protein n=1 Tax=Siminovitchia terrae TaxID=1914933 RepID=A0ABQ4KS20_SIMTE|nr:hypothetical protein J6TS1_06930 [Siminovitchia terrae]
MWGMSIDMLAELSQRPVECPIDMSILTLLPLMMDMSMKFEELPDLQFPYRMEDIIIIFVV